MMANRSRRSLKLERRRLVVGIGVLGTILLLVVVAFRANSGLPLTGYYTVTVDLPNAQRLVPTDAVRVGGVRVGQVRHITAIVPRAGAAYVRVGLRLDRDAGPLPLDSRAIVRQASVLGASYVDLRLGASRRTVPEGGRLAQHDQRPSVQLTDLLAVFNQATSTNIKHATRETALALAARGITINTALARLPTVLQRVARLSRLLAAPTTNLSGLIVAYDRFVDGLSPVAPRLAALMSSGAVSLATVARERGFLRRAFAEAPATEDAVVGGLSRLTPTLATLTTTVRTLRHSGRLLRPTLTGLDRALRAGERPLRRLPRTAPRLQAALRALSALAAPQSSSGSLNRARDSLAALGKTLDALVPAQVTCNVISLWGENFASGFGSNGFLDGPSAASAYITHLGADNEMFQNAAPSRNIAINNQPHLDARECEVGNEPYDGHQLLSNPPGLQSTDVRRTRPPAGVLDRARRAGLLDSEDR